jgi:hypothetical protein
MFGFIRRWLIPQPPTAECRRCFKLVEVDMRDLRDGDKFILNGGSDDNVKPTIVYTAKSGAHSSGCCAQVQVDDGTPIEVATSPRG